MQPAAFPSALDVVMLCREDNSRHLPQVLFLTLAVAEVWGSSTQD